MSQRALVDTNVVYGAFARRDQFHESALELVKVADSGRLPVLVVLDFVLAETLNAMVRDLLRGDALDAKAMLEESAGFVIRRTPDDAWEHGQVVFGRRERLSLVDSILVAAARGDGLEYVYSYDTGFDGIEDGTRSKTPTNPHAGS